MFKPIWGRFPFWHIFFKWVVQPTSRIKTTTSYPLRYWRVWPSNEARIQEVGWCMFHGLPMWLHIHYVSMFWVVQNSTIYIVLECRCFELSEFYHQFTTSSSLLGRLKSYFSFFVLLSSLSKHRQHSHVFFVFLVGFGEVFGQHISNISMANSRRV